MKLYSNVTFIFCVWALSILTIFYFGFVQFPHSERFPNDFFKSLANWDGGHFLGIAQYGYTEKFQYAFFPLYPILIKIVTSLTNNFLFSAILVSIGSFFLGLHFLYRLVYQIFDKKIADRSILALVFFPTSFYFLTAYSEGLFFLLTVLTFYFLIGRKYFWATVFAALASSVRFVGVALILSLILEVWITGINRKNWIVFLSPVGILIYCLFLKNQVGDPFYFFTAESHWQRSLSIPGLNFWESIKSLTSQQFLNINFNVLLDLLFAIFGLGFSIRSFRFLPLSFGIFALISIALPLFTSTLSSMPRFLLPIFPIFILLAKIKNQRITFFYQTISLMLLSAFATLFINGYWVS